MSSHKLKLHLGCGERYLDGYVNIDYPPSEHTVQANTKVDQYTDILSLRYVPETVEEVRLHHVFEHFPRATALALLAGWWSWLKVDGTLRIEVPDFERTAWAVLNPFSHKKARFVGLRHIFGSQEAGWAVHMDGWSAQSMRDVLSLFGYNVKEVKRKAWRGTYNIDVLAQKMPVKMFPVDFERAAQVWLKQYTVDDGISEQKMLGVWMKQYNTQISLM
jgi:predicted SAM-dependent methyltransferase